MDDDRREEMKKEHGWGDEELEIFEDEVAILELFETAEDPVLTTEEICDAVGLKRREAHDHLVNIAADGMVKRKGERLVADYCAAITGRGSSCSP